MESMYSGMGSEMLGLEMSLHHHPQQNPNSHHQLHLQHSNPQMVSFGDQSHNQAQKPGYSSYTPNKVVTKQITLNSDDDEPDSTNCSDGKMKNNTSPWQRMKWTDSMVKLLIMVVFYIGDEVGSDGTDPAGKKKAGGGGMLQKKGKWKTVSKAMMERGYYVSPQQCEDKFNDLNKRYKRVNDILGKGTSCKVVENQSLLDQMDHLSQKLKDEVKKLLNSKHLFFREMCAYHNSCGHGGGGAAVVAAEKPAHSHSHSQPQLQEKCLHETEVVLKLPEEDEEEDNDETLDDEDDDEVYLEDEQDGHDQFEERNLKKRARKEGGEEESGLVQQLSNELMGVVEDGRRSEVEKRRWLKGRLLMLEEQRVSFNVEAFELEKQRLKWEKFSGKKEREMEREKIKNERCKLETDRMILMLRKKGLELAIQQPLSQYSSSSSEKRRMEPSSTTGC